MAINDPTHDWAPQHRAWNNGAMDGWVSEHIAANGPLNGPVTMGYYTRADIPVHYALADAFTVCDHYFSSVMGPTNPNRLFWISGTNDPGGEYGGPLLYTSTTRPGPPQYTWTRTPRCSSRPGSAGRCTRTSRSSSSRRSSSAACSTGSRPSRAARTNPLYAKGVATKYPHDFKHDVEHDTLPSVSWIVPSLLTCEHPALPAAFGAMGIIHVLDILTSNPAVWEKTALIVSYDENGGLFDHVAAAGRAARHAGRVRDRAARRR